MKDTKLVTRNGRAKKNVDMTIWSLSDYEKALEKPKTTPVLPPVVSQIDELVKGGWLDTNVLERDNLQQDIFRSQLKRVQGPTLAKLESTQMKSHLIQLASLNLLQDLDARSKHSDSVPPPAYYPPKPLQQPMGGFIPTNKEPRGFVPRPAFGEPSLFDDVFKSNTNGSSTKKHNFIAPYDFLPSDSPKEHAINFIDQNRKSSNFKSPAERAEETKNRNKDLEMRKQVILARRKAIHDQRQKKRAQDAARSKPGYRTMEREQEEIRVAEVEAQRRWVTVISVALRFQQIEHHIRKQREAYRAVCAAIKIQYIMRKVMKNRRLKALKNTKVLLNTFLVDHLEKKARLDELRKRQVAVEIISSFLHDCAGYRARKARSCFDHYVEGVKIIQRTWRLHLLRKRWRFAAAQLQYELMRGELAYERVSQAWKVYKNKRAKAPEEESDDNKLMTQLNAVEDDNIVIEKILQVLFGKRTKIKLLPPSLRFPDLRSNLQIRQEVDQDLIAKYLKVNQARYIQAMERYNTYKQQVMGGVAIPGVNMDSLFEHTDAGKRLAERMPIHRMTIPDESLRAMHTSADKLVKERYKNSKSRTSVSPSE